MTFLAVISFSSPVFGFLPSLEFFFLTENVPKLEILTSLPFSREDNISSIISSNILDESDNEIPISD